jgi:hypothetical protein
MLLDLALVPEVFEEGAYSVGELCGHCLRTLTDVLLEQAVVRDLRNGAWSKHMKLKPGQWHPATAEIIEALAKQKRLYLFPPALSMEPDESREWCYEALATHKAAPLDGIVCGNGVSGDFPGDALVQPLEKIHDSTWYKNRTMSVRLRRQSADYLKQLQVILKWSSSAMFIDAHLDPSRPGYAEFYRLLETARRRPVPPLIELHRCSYDGVGASRRMLSYGDVDSMFAPLSAILKNARLKATVFVWDTMHDRYLITNLIGLSVPNGFDISNDTKALTTWTRVSPKDSEDIQREFDPASRRHQLRWQFDIGKPDEE